MRLLAYIQSGWCALMLCVPVGCMLCTCSVLEGREGAQLPRLRPPSFAQAAGAGCSCVPPLMAEYDCTDAWPLHGVTEHRRPCSTAHVGGACPGTARHNHKEGLCHAVSYTYAQRQNCARACACHLAAGKDLFILEHSLAIIVLHFVRWEIENEDMLWGPLAAQAWRKMTLMPVFITCSDCVLLAGAQQSLAHCRCAPAPARVHVYMHMYSPSRCPQ